MTRVFTLFIDVVNLKKLIVCEHKLDRAMLSQLRYILLVLIVAYKCFGN
jgi:hypothetical protein